MEWRAVAETAEEARKVRDAIVNTLADGRGVDAVAGTAVVGW
jgi:hypothetical protein